MWLRKLFFKFCLLWSHKTLNTYFENNIFVYRTRFFISSCVQGTLAFYQVYVSIHLCPWYTGTLPGIHLSTGNSGVLPCLWQYIAVSRVHRYSTRFMPVCICVQGTLVFYQVYVSIHLSTGYSGVLPGLWQYIAVSRVHRYSTKFVPVHNIHLYPGYIGFYQVYISIHLCPWYTGVLSGLCQYIHMCQ